MTKKDLTHLSRRERQIMDILFEAGEASASTVLENLPEPPSYSTVRALLARLEQKSYVRHRADGPRYVYTPTIAMARARKNALDRVVQTFFDGSAAAAATALLGLSGRDLSAEELEDLAGAIAKAREEGR